MSRYFSGVFDLHYSLFLYLGNWSTVCLGTVCVGGIVSIVPETLEMALKLSSDVNSLKLFFLLVIVTGSIIF